MIEYRTEMGGGGGWGGGRGRMMFGFGAGDGIGDEGVRGVRTGAV
mgnify:CR=1 FL=1